MQGEVSYDLQREVDLDITAWASNMKNNAAAAKSKRIVEKATNLPAAKSSRPVGVEEDFTVVSPPLNQSQSTSKQSKAPRRYLKIRSLLATETGTNLM